MDKNKRLPSAAPEVAQSENYPEVDTRQPVYADKASKSYGDVAKRQNDNYVYEEVARSPDQYAHELRRGGGIRDGFAEYLQAYSGF